MMNIRNQILFMEEDMKHKIQERQDLIVQAVIRKRQGGEKSPMLKSIVLVW